MPTLLRDGECDAACNTESCDWDEGDCFHHHGLAAGPGSLCPWFSSVPAPAERLTAPAGECYRRDDGADYRGTVKTTKDGVECQALLSAMSPKGGRLLYGSWGVTCVHSAGLSV